ncbi:hypothetical protein [Streptomyces sp. TRM49041]|uniref:hypothetical protein n=1 Tax=Streptomyces sp. TRM49041 TaxID=2603216 RepID=UPI0011EEE7C6|nr:hypothetical protein [Streptomyces sp. TRM49041]
MSPQARLVDQIVFRWDTDNLSGTTGFGPVACSCPPERADAVFRRTGALLRATGEATAPALLRLESGDTVMLVHRAPWRDAGVRASTVCHALMGPSAVLDPATCLGLHTWSWDGGGLPLAEVRGTLPKVDEAALLPAADDGQRLLTGGLAQVRRELTGAVAEFLRDPKAGFTLLDPSGTAACRVLWGLHGIFGGQVGRRWTFATHDTAETEQLRFVFVSRWTGEASGHSARRRTDPAERCGDRAEAVADRLVRHQLREEYEVGAALQRVAARHRASRGGPMSLLALAEAALSALGPPDQDAAPPPLPPSPPSPRPRPRPPVPVAAPEWPAPSEDRDRPRMPRWLGGAGPGPRRRPGRGDLLAAVQDPFGAHAGEAVSAAPDDELLGALGMGAGYEALTLLMTEVAERWPSWGREQRTALGAVLLDQELYVTDRAGHGHPGDDVRAANAASVYRWAVRPVLDDPELAARVTYLLPRLVTAPHRAARAAVRQITDSPAPGLPEATWQALLKATRARRGAHSRDRGPRSDDAPDSRPAPPPQQTYEGEGRPRSGPPNAAPPGAPGGPGDARRPDRSWDGHPSGPTTGLDGGRAPDPQSPRTAPRTPPRGGTWDGPAQSAGGGAARTGDDRPPPGPGGGRGSPHVDRLGGPGWQGAAERRTPSEGSRDGRPPDSGHGRGDPGGAGDGRSRGAGPAVSGAGPDGVVPAVDGPSALRSGVRQGPSDMDQRGGDQPMSPDRSPGGSRGADPPDGPGRSWDGEPAPKAGGRHRMAATDASGEPRRQGDPDRSADPRRPRDEPGPGRPPRQPDERPGGALGQPPRPGTEPRTAVPPPVPPAGHRPTGHRPPGRATPRPPGEAPRPEGADPPGRAAARSRAADDIRPYIVMGVLVGIIVALLVTVLVLLLGS